MIIASLLLALSGLYESYSYPFFLRWLYWGILVGIGIWLNDALSHQLVPLLKDRPWLIRWLVHTTVLAIPLFTFVIAIQGFSDGPVSFAYYSDIAIKVWLVTAVLTAFGMREVKVGKVSENILSTERRHEDRQLSSGNTTLLNRLKPELKTSSLLALAAEDHYVRVITSAGEELILLRFSDAIAEAHLVKGFQVHRSWWVAEHAIKALEKNNASAELRLINGMLVPVSRRRLVAVKQICERISQTLQ